MIRKVISVAHVDEAELVRQITENRTVGFFGVRNL